MLNLHEWAARWGVPVQAITELHAGLMWHEGEEAALPEASVLARVRLEASRKGVYLWRNNMGAGKIETEDGTTRFLRWGLANDSKRLNSILKSSDLIGVRKRMIQPTDVGQLIGQFVARECKRPGWKYTGTPEETAQMRFITLVNAHGGDAAFTTAEGSI